LRKAGFNDRIVLVSSEAHPPYQRPPLSKDFLLGRMALERLFFRSAEAWQALDIDLWLNRKVATLDRAAKRVLCEDGSSLAYDRCVLATGSAARELPHTSGLSNVLTLRDLPDAQRLGEAVRRSRRIVIVGAGYLGLEVAAACRKLDKDVSVLEAADTVLARTASQALARHVEGRHREEGVDLRLGAAVTRLVSDAGVVSAVDLSDGESIPCDLVLVAIGGRPRTEIAEAAGLQCANGILVDADCRTSDPDVFAIGDCAAWDLGVGPMRHESVHAAAQGAKAVTSAIIGTALPRVRPPYFWSTQFDMRIQISGCASGRGLSEVLVGEPTSGKFAVERRSDEELVALEAVNMPDKFLAAQNALASKL
jgi:3-phenylpropionate/trans-cinnamate dioxygenase ferredoxin reductase subunit